jgi:hypothetical protein
MLVGGWALSISGAADCQDLSRKVIWSARKRFGAPDGMSSRFLGKKPIFGQTFFLEPI